MLRIDSFLLAVAVLRPTFATSAAVQIDAALPEVLRERVAAILRTLRPRDAAAALDATRVLDDPWRNGGSLVMRVEVNCRHGLCMTVIARVTEHAVEPELILNAGKSFYMPDAAYPLWGSDWSVWWLVFEGENGARLLAGKRDGRWVVQAEGPSDPAKRVVIEPRAPPPPVPFEDFRRDIGREP